MSKRKRDYLGQLQVLLLVIVVMFGVGIGLDIKDTLIGRQEVRTELDQVI